MNHDEDDLIIPPADRSLNSLCTMMGAAQATEQFHSNAIWGPKVYSQEIAKHDWIEFGIVDVLYWVVKDELFITDSPLRTIQ